MQLTQGFFIDLVGRLLYCGQNFTESRGAWTFWFWRKMFQHCSWNRWIMPGKTIIMDHKGKRQTFPSRSEFWSMGWVGCRGEREGLFGSRERELKFTFSFYGKENGIFQWVGWFTNSMSEEEIGSSTKTKQNPVSALEVPPLWYIEWNVPIDEGLHIVLLHSCDSIIYLFSLPLLLGTPIYFESVAAKEH